MGIPEKIKAIQDEMAKTQINKATEHHLGLLRAKIAKLKREQEEGKSKKGSTTDGFDVRRAGDATVVFIGLPSVGKSTLLNRITGAKSAVGAFQFTTLTVVPGMMEYKGARIQVLDLPGIIKGASSGKGLGKRILSVARNADLVLLVLDVFQPYHEDVLVNELGNIGIRLNQDPPNIVVEKTHTGGIAVAQQIKLTKMSEKLLKDILNVYGMTSARVVIREDITSEQLIDFISGSKTYSKALTIINKIDLVDETFLKELRTKIKSDFIEVSADSNVNIDLLKERIYEKLRFIRIYMRPKGGETDFKEPLITRDGSTIGDICDKLHRNMRKDFRYAMVWGKSVKFGGQRVGITHVLQDEDVLTIIKSR
ncbi:GTP-binding protein [Nitrosopumilus sp. b1]|uniref:OBG GTPase family GTP-binding protein n=1 Tax=Nitrosopumilus sp. b1 TaxID=2109907 RepID=UPI000E2E275F|nr:GTP-binding protein [Nitrosopumilus sp. b1]RDJ31326.1 MAG: GTP-binding protein [Thermoproteota archaeon]KAF6242948.1 GTP-binding protein [Nitrosopumilus sp. b1]RDJ33899.1 MAG: GTP-binding protein [Thermoproteota archaeon]RDJ36989.1 MAG: GTP-binding protein [Thermoproteota archaeon]RDJ37476.1 MAG: GTP-binding protein [Thermoproteota archaeon]